MDVNVVALGPKSKGITPLHLAAEGGPVDIIEELLDRGADIDARTKGACGWTPLHSAAKARKREAVKFLIENGAFLPEDINDNRFNSPLHYCPGLEWAYEEMKWLQLNSSSVVTQILVVFVKMFNMSREENERLADAEKKKQEKEAAKERPMATVLPVKR